MVTLNILGLIKKCYDTRASIACSTLTTYNAFEYTNKQLRIPS